MEIKKYLLIGMLGVGLSLGCGRKNERYEVINVKGQAYLLDKDDYEKRLITNGVVGSVDDFVKRVEESGGSEAMFSKSYKLKVAESLVEEGYSDRIFGLIPPSEREGLVRKEFLGYGLSKQWEFVRLPLQKKAEEGFDALRKDVERIIADIKESPAVSGAGDVSQEKLNESYDMIKKYLGGT